MNPAALIAEHHRACAELHAAAVEFLTSLGFTIDASGELRRAA